MPLQPPPTTRLEAFTDAVIAIALTIMVLELHPADILTQQDAPAILKVLRSKILVYPVELHRHYEGMDQPSSLDGNSPTLFFG
jgi:hypothetical protein